MRHLASRLAVPAALAAAVLPSGTPQAGVHFDRGTSARDVPFQFDNRQLLMRVVVNERDSLWFVADTGSSGSVIDSGRAASLGLQTEGTQRSLGAGGEQEGSTVHGVDLALPGLQLTDQTLDTLPLDALRTASGRRVDGILGHSLFESCVVEIDYARSMLHFHVPRTFEYRGQGTILPIERIENHPYVHARAVLPGGRAITGRFVVDTGSSAGVILSPSATAADSITRSFPRTLASQGQGVGAAVPVRLGRLERFVLGDRSLAGPIVVLQPPGAGRVSAPGASGNIGGGILSRFKVIFDYSRARIILEPGPTFDDPFEVDMSGLVLAAGTPEDPALRVVRVQDDSPATSARVQAGDRVESVDDTPASDIDLVALRERLRREGQVIRLLLRRGTTTRTVEVRTRRLL